MVRALLSVNVLREIVERTDKTRAALRDGSLSPAQVGTALADIDRLVVAVNESASILRAIDMALDRRAHTR